MQLGRLLKTMGYKTMNNSNKERIIEKNSGFFNLEPPKRREIIKINVLVAAVKKYHVMLRENGV